MEKRNIVYYGLNDLKPYEKNNKKHPTRQIKLIAESISRFGFNTPIIVDGELNIDNADGCKWYEATP